MHSLTSYITKMVETLDTTDLVNFIEKDDACGGEGEEEGEGGRERERERERGGGGAGGRG